MRKIIPNFTESQLRQESQKQFQQQITVEDMHRLTHHQYAKNSVLSMANDWNRFVAFCQSKHVCALPSSVTAVRLFLEKESKVRKFSSIRRTLITVSLIHKIHQAPDPSAHRQVLQTMGQIQRLKKGDASHANPMTQKHLNKLDTLLNQSKRAKDIRDLAIYYVMFETLLKRGQLRSLDIQHLTFNESNQPDQIILEEMSYPLSTRASQCLSAWLGHREIPSDVLFCGIDRHGYMSDHRLNDSSIYRVLRRASELLKLPEHLQFSGQSTRIGGAQQLHGQGASVVEIQHFGRWLSPAMPAQYLGKSGLSEKEMTKFKQFKPVES